MDTIYPENLFAAIAKNILLRQKGLPATQNIVKQAQETQPATTDFLHKYHLNPAQFANDPAAAALINPQTRASAWRIRQYFQDQAHALGGMNDSLRSNQKLLLGSLEEAANKARIEKSIQGTMAAEQQDPARFGQLLDTSNRSQEAFRHNPSPTIGASIGGGLGGLGGWALGKTPLQRSALGVASGIGGAAVGHFAGRHVAEKQTGYAHQDVLPPYAVASRLQKQIHTDTQKRT